MPLRAAILAAGEGVRLLADGIATPKPLVPVNGEPLIVRLARQLRSAGADETHALVHPRAAASVQMLHEAGLEVHCRLGTTPASFLSLCELLNGIGDGPLLVCLVDAVFATADLERFVERVQQASSPQTTAWLGVTRFVHDETPLRVRVEDDGRVSAVGGAASASSPLITGGVYWFGRGMENEVARARHAGVERLRGFLSRLVTQGSTVRGHEFGRIVDLDTAEDLALAEAAGR